MRDETRVILRDMETWPWFEHVGEPINDPSVIALGSWNEATDPHRSYVWECLRIQVNNVRSSVLRERDWHRVQTWNQIGREVKEDLKPIFGHIRALGSRLSLPENAFFNQVTWDLIRIGMETEYSDVHPPTFTVPVLAPWYRAGRFPCGWDGPVLDTYWNGEFPPYHLYVY